MVLDIFSIDGCVYDVDLSLRDFLGKPDIILGDSPLKCVIAYPIVSEYFLRVRKTFTLFSNN